MNQSIPGFLCPLSYGMYGAFHHDHSQVKAKSNLYSQKSLTTNEGQNIYFRTLESTTSLTKRFTIEKSESFFFFRFR